MYLVAGCIASINDCVLPPVLVPVPALVVVLCKVFNQQTPGFIDDDGRHGLPHNCSVNLRACRRYSMDGWVALDIWYCCMVARVCLLHHMEVAFLPLYVHMHLDCEFNLLWYCCFSLSIKYMFQPGATLL